MTTSIPPPPGPHDPYGHGGNYPPQPPPGGNPPGNYPPGNYPPGNYPPQPPPTQPQGVPPVGGYPPGAAGGYPQGYPQQGPPGYPPQGPPPTGPPTGPYGSQPPRRRSAAPVVFGITAAIVVLLGVVVATVVVLTRDEGAEASEVFLQASTEPGPDPFTQSVAGPPEDQGGGGTTSRPGNASTTSPTVPPASGGGQRTYDGGQPGLYGGTRDYGSCDPEKLVTFLDQNPDKKAAWAGVLGISTSEVRSYVSGLTSVILRTDTYVTNHGFANGRATSLQAVLQAGTAVMVDKYGVPRVKCYCGNPLTPPSPYRSPVYKGTRWSWFNLSTIVIIKQNVTVINNFLLLDNKGQPFSRPAGSNGGTDADGPDQQPASTTSTTTEEETTTSAPPPTFQVPTNPSVPPPTPAPAPTTTRYVPSTPPPTYMTTTTAGHGITFEEAYPWFLQALQNCGIDVTDWGLTGAGPNVFNGSADWLVGGVPNHGTWRVTFTNGVGSMTPTNPDASVCG